jgi:protein TonB
VPENGIVVTSRAVLPPLHVEVVAGNRKTTVHPGSSSMRVDIDPPPLAPAPDAPPASPSVEVASAGPAPLTNASDRMHMSTDAELELEHAAQPEYPMLARQMKVQGSVTLEALIGRDGGIQQLQVLQGPAILADAARQAVRQWRFKPYLQDGQAVETQAHITVNFTISTN